MALTYYATLSGARAAKVAAGGVGDIAWAGLTNKSKPFSLATGEDMAQVNIDADRTFIKAYDKFTGVIGELEKVYEEIRTDYNKDFIE